MNDDGDVMFLDMVVEIWRKIATFNGSGKNVSDKPECTDPNLSLFISRKAFLYSQILFSEKSEFFLGFEPRASGIGIKVLVNMLIWIF